MRNITVFLLCSFFTTFPLSADWPQWRGLDNTGASADAEPPLHFGPTQNVLWKVELPGRGHASPIVFGDRVYVMTSAPVEGAVAVSELPEDADERTRRWWDRAIHPLEQDLLVLALDRASGKEIWRRTAARVVPTTGTHQDGTWASASPVTDGAAIYAHFGSLGLFAYDLDGELLWQRDLGDMVTRNGFGEGASPAVWDDSLVVVWDHENESFIYSLNAKTGETRWKKPREEPTSWATPLIVEVNGRAQAVVPGTGRSRGYDLATGEVLWELSGMTVNTIPTPPYADGLAYLTSGFRGSALQAVRLADAWGELTVGAEAEGDAPAVAPSKAIAWSRGRDTPYVPSTLLYDGKLYFFKSYSNILTCVDAATGETVFQGRLEGVQNVYASPVAADGKIYVASREGEVVVLAAGKLEVLARTSFEEGFDASPALSGDMLFLRGSRHLWAFGVKELDIDVSAF